MNSQSVKYSPGYQYIIQGNYQQAAVYYEQAIEEKPSVKINYWYLGLCLILQGQEEEATLAWLLGMGETDDEAQIEIWTLELSQVLELEAERQEKLEEKKLAWTIRQHLRTVNPIDVNNLLKSLLLAIELKILDQDYLDELNILHILESDIDNIQIDINLILKISAAVLDFAPLENFTTELIQIFTKIIHHHPDNHQKFINILISAAIKIISAFRNPVKTAEIIENLLLITPDNSEVLIQLSISYQDSEQYLKGIETAKKLNSLEQTFSEQVFSNHLLIRSFMKPSGYWDETCAAFAKQESLIRTVINESPRIQGITFILRLFTSMFFFPYIKDEPEKIRPLQNQLMSLCVKNIEKNLQDIIPFFRKTPHGDTRKDKVLKIGYLANSLRQHSVGWIARWLFDYHDHEKFQIYSYIMLPTENDNGLQQLFRDKSDYSYSYDSDQTYEAVKQIHQDGIDILVELDSLTFDISAEILAIKPAPIQVSWLGWDATGLPTIDYFIADDYVLPENAQDYYQEKIWRLPQTYVAVDGFEVNVPTLRREELDIPEDAIVYFVTQKGYKRHLEHSKLQIEIIKQVPNSYLLIKGDADEEATKKFYGELAELKGVDISRFKFLPYMPTEAIHRANLGLSDVVLDTFPYNGATTTLETLWREIPLVTKVGKQFAARNSYGMMMNAGITEGIAWSDEEYVEWGVRLGKDENLRKEVAWKLKQGKKNAPLWNGKQFTLEMEKAYRQMWEIYVDNLNK